MVFIQEGYLDITLGLLLWMRSTTDVTNNGDMLDWTMIVIFGVVAVVYPIGSLIFMCRNKDKFYKAYIRDKSL